MKDGGYYEGQFENGEMSGSGQRKWTINGNTFEGDFMKGELHGNGVMKYGDGSVYEGEWKENRREGEGILTDANGTVYKGSFYKNREHGDGLEVLRNGQTYNGSWVFGSKQGHGIMKFCDGSVYEGQWRSNMFNGEGSYVHCSGATYNGMWINGRPEVDATEIYINGAPEIEIEQGQSFDLEIFCRNSSGEVSHESGRLLLVMGGIRSTEAATTTRTSLSEETGDQPEATYFSTPFGFDVEPYPLIESRKQQQRPEQEAERPNIQADLSFASTDSGHGDKSVSKQVALTPITDQSPDIEKQSHFPPHNQNSEHFQEEAYPTSSEATKVRFQKTASEKIFSFDEATSAQVFIDEERNNDEKSSNLSVLTEDGRVSLCELLFPPPPQAAHGSLLRSSPDSEGRLSVKGIKKAETASVSSSIHVEKEKKKGKADSSIADNEKLRDLRDKDGKRKKERKDEKVTEEKFCRPGDYVVIVQDITASPFLDTVLKTAFLHVKVENKSKKGKATNRKLNVT
eukprot:gene11224-21408_t